ncbi:MAG: cation-translocating P-type ATPase [Dissulfurimicrobium sp.]|uniref:cation-translocating P-type ATPase n=1 Tax=Dissulfurimicrobium sp. TaxID=2022436 RepID=UPI004049E01D
MMNFDITKVRGLSEEEVRERIEKYGLNELPSSKPRNVLQTALEVIREPMFILLMICGGLYLMLGDLKEALMLLGFVFVVMGITFYQERKTEKALDALRDLSSPRALVIRGGEEIRVAGRDVVMDDLIVLKEGDRVPADAVVLQSINLTVEESLLTGESVPVIKSDWDGKMGKVQPGGDGLPFVYSGTMVTQGRGYARVVATGVETELGKIGKAMEGITEEDSKLRKETERFVKTLLFVGGVLCVVIIIVYGATRGDFIQGFLSGITFAMAMFPEEFPVVLTIFMALGAWRLSKKHVLTRKMSAIETLGMATVLCVDKTGTLTQNRMQVRKIYSNGQYFNINEENAALPENFHQLVEYGILASQRDPFDPMERAITELGRFKLADTGHLHLNWNLIREYPLSKELLAMSHVWTSPDRSKYIIAAKGAPEAIFDLCHLPEGQKQALSDVVKEMASQGLRVLGVARSFFKPGYLPQIQHDFEFEFLGFIGLFDPVRPAVKDAIRECYRAGIKVIMITGDYSVTAQYIGRQIGLKDVENCITGLELECLTDEELSRRIKETSIFARVIPEQKLRIVNALKANGEVVAMTGDGVNDAPALKSSHIGIAMGSRGTDVAREAAALVLLDDDFSSIVAAVRLGRRIFDNMRKAMAYILSIHIPIAGMSLIPVFFEKLPIVFWPVHIVFFELIIDPTCSIVFEAEREENDIMDKPPRPMGEPLFSVSYILISVLQGLGVLATICMVYGIAIYLGKATGEIRALVFTTLIIANIGLTLTNRSWTRTIPEMLKTRNMALSIAVTGVMIFLAFVLYVPFLRDAFHFGVLHLNDLLYCFTAGCVSILWFEIFKIFARKKMFFNM